MELTQNIIEQYNLYKNADEACDNDSVLAYRILNGLMSAKVSWTLSVVNSAIIQRAREDSTYAKWYLDMYGNTDHISMHCVLHEMIRHNDLRFIDESEPMPELWYFNVPSETTCRDLVQRNIKYKYTVGRICAVAGYTTLYKELDLYPEVHILHDAMEYKNQEILDMVTEKAKEYDWSTAYYYNGLYQIRRSATDYDMHNAMYSVQRLQYPIPDVYVDSLLIKDTDIFTEILSGVAGPMYRVNAYTIDMKVSLIDSIINRTGILAPESVKICTDLINGVQSDLHRLYSAINGNVLEYSKYGTHILSDKELCCVVHGIYKSIEFAMWCKDNITNTDIQLAVSESLVMNNDLSYILDDIYCIWHPTIPTESTCRMLYDSHPNLAYLIGRVCVIAGYHTLYNSMMLPPETHIVHDAKLSGKINIHVPDCMWKSMDDISKKLIVPFPIPGKSLDYMPYTSLTTTKSCIRLNNAAISIDDIETNYIGRYLLRDGGLDCSRLTSKIDFIMLHIQN